MSSKAELVFVCLLASGAAAAPLTADVSLIRRLDQEAYKEEPFRAPYAAVFSREPKTLIFIAGDHKDGVNSGVSRMVRWAFKTYKPQAVVVEGLTANSPADEKKWLVDGSWYAEHKPDEIGENYYPAWYAHKRGVPYVGGEPSLLDKMAALKPHGYKPEDLLGLSVAGNLGAYNVSRPHSPEELAKMLDSEMTREAKLLGLEKFTYADYERWYAERGGVGKKPNELDVNDMRPESGEGANFLQKMAGFMELERETTIVRQIEEQLRKRDRVLVVYGSGHLVRQRPVWKAALGPSKDIQPVK